VLPSVINDIRSNADLSGKWGEKLWRTFQVISCGLRFRMIKRSLADSIELDKRDLVIRHCKGIEERFA